MSENNMDQNYWRSFSELYNGEKFTKDKTFLENASTAPMFKQCEDNRRRFIGLMSASAALAGTAYANYRDEGELIPHNEQSETTTPGKAYHFASTIALNGVANSVLVKVREGDRSNQWQQVTPRL